MGIRIHKVLGYGLTDLGIADPRMNLDTFQENYYNDKKFHSYDFKEEYDSFGDEEFEKFLLDKGYKDPLTLENRKDKATLLRWWIGDRDRDRAAGKKLDSWYSFDVFKTGCSDYGIKGVFCVTLPWNKDWERYDDLLDYTEHAYDHGYSCKDEVKIFDGAIYPYLEFINLKTGVQIEDFSGLREVSNVRDLKRISKKEKLKKLDEVVRRDIVVETIGRFTDYADYKKHVKPKTPKEIVELCEFYKIFKDIKTAETLIPMIYTYWG